MRSYSEQEIAEAIARAGLSVEDAARLRAELLNASQVRAGFEAAHIAYYFGGLLICGAMGWFITDAWDSLPGFVLSAIALAYAALFGGAGYWLSRRPATWIPGGVLLTVAVCMTPLAVYGIERQFGWWPVGNPGGYARFHPYINGSWVLMEACTLFASAAALRLVRFPFLTAPAAYALWYLSMDAPRLVTGYAVTFHQQCWITVAFGCVTLCVAYFADGDRAQDFAFWFYLFGLLAFSGGLMAMGGGTQLGKAIFCAVHLLLVVLSVVLQRRAFLVVGTIGVLVYLVGEASRYFRNSFSFPLVLTCIGVAVIVSGLAYKRHEADLAATFSAWIPDRIKHRHATSHAAI